MDSLRSIFSDPLCATFISVLIGGLITWVAAWCYYKKAGVELLKETALLRKANMAIVYMLDHPDASIEVRRDNEGNPIGLIVSATGHASGDSSARGFAVDGSVSDP